MRSELSSQHAKGDESIKLNVPIQSRMMPTQLAIDEKLANMGQAAHQRFGENMQAKTFVKAKDQQKWIAKHKAQRKEDETDITQRKNIEFAKDLFLSWDDDGSGELSASEIIKPLVSLGLAPNSDFARKILTALDPRTTQ